MELMKGGVAKVTATEEKKREHKEVCNIGTLLWRRGNSHKKGIT